jgi:hypothetical protein
MLEFVLPGVRNQLHLLGRPGPSGESPTNQGATDIRRVYQQFRFRQVYPNYFSGIFCSPALWISPPSVQIATAEVGGADSIDFRRLKVISQYLQMELSMRKHRASVDRLVVDSIRQVSFHPPLRLFLNLPTPCALPTFDQIYVSEFASPSEPYLAIWKHMTAPASEPMFRLFFEAYGLALRHPRRFEALLPPAVE